MGGPLIREPHAVRPNEPRRHKIPKARYRVENWRAHDAALRERGSLTVWVTPEAIAARTSSRTGRQGRPQAYADLAVDTGLLHSIMGLLGLELSVPDHITFSRRSINLRVVPALRQEGPVHIIIDPTGLKVFGTGEWQLEEHGSRARRSWRKLHLAVNPDSGGILASALTVTDAGDASVVGPLLD